MTSPFKFLDSYTKEDKSIFFGRDRETEELYHKVFESKVMLVYGVSGTGKSSLINCGLASKFSESDWLPVNVRRGRDINESLRIAVERGLQPETRNPKSEIRIPINIGTKSESATSNQQPATSNVPLKKLLKNLYLDHFKPVFLIFDQFEELFIFGSRAEKEEFVKSVKTIVESDLQVRFMFVIREEYLAGITEFEKQIPTILSNRVRIEKMTRVNAQQAIEGPCKYAGIEVEDGFAEKLLDKLSPDGHDVELTYLQVYLDKVFRSATSRLTSLRGGTTQQSLTEGGLSFTQSLLDELGDVKDLLGSFLEEQIAQLQDPDTALVVLKAFVSAKGTKRQVTEEDVLDYSRTLGKNISIESLRELILRFVNLRILRDKDESGRYELRHDALAAKIYEKITLVEKELLEVRQFIENAYDNFKRRRVMLSASDLSYIAPYEDKMYLSGQLSDFVNDSKKEISKAKRRKRNLAIAAGVSLIVIMTGFTWWAMNERGKAETELKNSINNMGLICLEKAEQAITDLDLNAIRLYSLYAYKYLDDSLKHKAMTNIISYPYFPVEYRIPYHNLHDNFIIDAAFTTDDKYLITSSGDNTIKCWNIETGDIKYTLNQQSRSINSIDIMNNFLISGSSDGTVILWDVNTGKNLKIFYFDQPVSRIEFIQGTKYFFAHLEDDNVSVCSIEDINMYVALKNVTTCDFSLNGSFYYVPKDSNSIYQYNVFNQKTTCVKHLSKDENIQKIRVSDYAGKIVFITTNIKNNVVYSSDIIEKTNINLCDLKTFKTVLKIDGSSFDISDDGKRMIIQGENKVKEVYTLSDLKKININWNYGTYSGFAFQNKKDIIAGFRENTVKLYDIKSEKILNDNIAVSENYSDCYSSKDKSIVLIKNSWNEIYVYNTKNQKMSGIIYLTSYDFCYDRKSGLLIASSGNQNYKIWDTKQFKIIGELCISDKQVSLRHLNSNKLYYSAEENNKNEIKIIDINSKQLQLSDLPFSEQYIPTVVFSDNERYMVYQTDKGLVLYDLEDQKLIKTIDDYIKNTENISRILFGNNENLIVQKSGSIDIYLTETGDLKCSRKFSNNVSIESVSDERCLIYDRINSNYYYYVYNNCGDAAIWGGTQKRTMVNDFNSKYYISQPKYKYIEINCEGYHLGTIMNDFNTWESSIYNYGDNIIIRNNNKIWSHAINVFEKFDFKKVKNICFCKQKNLISFLNTETHEIEIWEIDSKTKIKTVKPKNDSKIVNMRINNEGTYLAVSYESFPIQIISIDKGKEYDYFIDPDWENISSSFFREQSNYNANNTQLVYKNTNYFINKPSERVTNTINFYSSEIFIRDFSDTRIKFQNYMEYVESGFSISDLLRSEFDTEQKKYIEYSDKIIAGDKYIIKTGSNYDVYDFKSKKYIARLTGSKATTNPELSPDCKFLASFDSEKLIVWDLNTFEQKCSFVINDVSFGIEYTNDSRYIYTLTRGGILYCIDIKEGKELYALRGFSENSWVFLSKDDKSMYVYDGSTIQHINLDEIKSKMTFDVDMEINKLEENLRMKLEGIELVPFKDQTPNLYKAIE